MTYEPPYDLMRTDPHLRIDDVIENLVDKVILELNPELFDDDMPDALNDFANRQEAIIYLLEKLMRLMEE